MSKITKTCECCGKPMQVRAADVARGWGRFCSKTCKASKQARSGSYPRHDGKSPMKHKVCAECGQPAVNGVHVLSGKIEWYCLDHMADAMTHPFSEEALQW